VQQAGEEDLALHPGQVGTQAVVRARAEAERGDLLAGHVEHLRLLDLCRIAVGGGNQAEHHAARGDFEAFQLGWLERGPHHELDRRLKAQDLGDCPRRYFWIFPD
jgi:hypothetical protein